MRPHIAIFVRGGVVQEVASDTADVLIKVLDMDVLEEREIPDEWAAPDVVIPDAQDFEAYTSGGDTPERHPSIDRRNPRMQLMLKCTAPEFSPDDIEWALVTLDAPLLERALARRQIFRQSQRQDDELYEMYFWDTSPDFFALAPDPAPDHTMDEDESLENTLRDHTGQPIEWAKDLHCLSDETSIPDVYLRAVECARMRVDARGIAWTCYPKHLDVAVRTGTIPWELLESQRLFAPPPLER
jgi:hypothetical protein